MYTFMEIKTHKIFNKLKRIHSVFYIFIIQRQSQKPAADTDGQCSLYNTEFKFVQPEMDLN